MNDDEIEKYLCAIGEITIQKLNKPYVEYVKKYGQKKRISENIVNGRITLYFNPMQLKKGEKYIPAKKPSWKLKIYIKEISTIKYIHFELTLNKKYLERKRIPKTLPTTSKPSWLKRIKLKDFVTFAKIDWEKLAHDTQNIMRPTEEASQSTGQRYKRMLLYSILLAIGRNMPACRQKHLAYKVFKMTHKRRLQEKFRKEKYYKLIKLFAE